MEVTLEGRLTTSGRWRRFAEAYEDILTEHDGWSMVFGEMTPEEQAADPDIKEGVLMHVDIAAQVIVFGFEPSDFTAGDDSLVSDEEWEAYMDANFKDVLDDAIPLAQQMLEQAVEDNGEVD